MNGENPHSQSIKDRLLNLAKEQGRPFNKVLQFYIIERFLYRLSRSSFANRFVLKGALLLVALDVPSLRPTRDIDLLGQTQNDVQHIAAVFRQLCSLEVKPDDGVWFDPDSVHATSIANNAQYHGVRVKAKGYLGKAQMPARAFCF